MQGAILTLPRPTWRRILLALYSIIILLLLYTINNHDVQVRVKSRGWNRPIPAARWYHHETYIIFGQTRSWSMVAGARLLSGALDKDSHLAAARRGAIERVHWASVVLWPQLRGLRAHHFGRENIMCHQRCQQPGVVTYLSKVPQISRSATSGWPRRISEEGSGFSRGALFIDTLTALKEGKGGKVCRLMNQNYGT